MNEETRCVIAGAGPGVSMANCQIGLNTVGHRQKKLTPG
jgi:hypothetical protein